MGYRLADWSDSELYKVGVTFETSQWGIFGRGSIIKLLLNEESARPYFVLVSGSCKTSNFNKGCANWSSVKPTQKTKYAVKKRKEAKSFADGVESAMLVAMKAKAKATKEQTHLPVQFVVTEGLNSLQKSEIKNVKT